MFKKFLKEHPVRSASIVVATFVTAGIAMSTFSYKAMAATYTTTANEGYYSETTYFLTEKAYDDYVEEQQIAEQQTPSIKTMSIGYSDNDENKQFVSAVSKSVWVTEKIDKDGNVLDSELMTKDEIDELNNISPSGIRDEYFRDTLFGGGGGGDDDDGCEFVGEETDDDNHKRLTITIKVEYDTQLKQYNVVGTASWKAEWVWVWEQNEAAEELAEDFIALTWGGNETILGKDESFDGSYYDGYGTFDGNKTQSDDYKGFIWSFYEKSGYLGKEMEKATAKVTLEPLYDYGKETNVMLTYVHTYNSLSLEGEISIGYDGEDTTYAAGISIGIEENNWLTEISVPGIEY